MEPFENASKRPKISSLTFAQEEPAQKKRKQSGKEADERSEWAVKKSETLKKDETKGRKVKVEHTPMSVLEKIFAFLDWTDKGRALLVCQRWKTVGGESVPLVRVPSPPCRPQAGWIQQDSQTSVGQICHS